MKKITVQIIVKIIVYYQKHKIQIQMKKNNKNMNT